MRAQPTQLLLRTAEEEPDTVKASCFPYSQDVAEYALLIALPERPGLRFELSPEAAKHPRAIDLCNSTVQGTRFPSN
jgi:hypothetical protein